MADLRADTLVCMDLLEALRDLAEYEAQNGRLPDTLNALQGSPPRDPFSDKPLRYRRDESGCLLYTVGGNGIDDNADPSLDIVARLGPPPDPVPPPGGRTPRATPPTA